MSIQSQINFPAPLGVQRFAKHSQAQILWRGYSSIWIYEVIFWRAALSSVEFMAQPFIHLDVSSHFSTRGAVKSYEEHWSAMKPCKSKNPSRADLIQWLQGANRLNSTLDIIVNNFKTTLQTLDEIGAAGIFRFTWFHRAPVLFITLDSAARQKITSYIQIDE